VVAGHPALQIQGEMVQCISTRGGGIAKKNRQFSSDDDISKKCHAKELIGEGGGHPRPSKKSKGGKPAYLRAKSRKIMEKPALQEGYERGNPRGYEKRVSFQQNRYENDVATRTFYIIELEIYAEAT